MLASLRVKGRRLVGEQGVISPTQQAKYGFALCGFQDIDPVVHTIRLLRSASVPPNLAGWLVRFECDPRERGAKSRGLKFTTDPNVGNFHCAIPNRI